MTIRPFLFPKHPGAGLLGLWLGSLVPLAANEPPPAAEPPPALAAWVAQDRLEAPAAGAVVFLGSSSIRRWESLTRDFGDYRILQRGWGGSRLEEMAAAYPWVVRPYRPSAVVMWAGTNDLSAGRGGDVVFQHFEAFRRLLRADFPDTPFLFLGMTPTLANGPTTPARKQANRLIREAAAQDPHTHFIDLATPFEQLSPEDLARLYVDPIHLNRAGYAKWREIIGPELRRIVPPPGQSFANPQAPVAGARLLFDFGPQDESKGRAVPSPDEHGLHWNHWHPVPAGRRLLAGEHKGNLVDSTGCPTGLRWILTGDYHLGGNPQNPQSPTDEAEREALGNLARPEALADYVFSTADDRWEGGEDDLTGGFLLTGLNPARPCEIRIYGSSSDEAGGSMQVVAYARERHAVALQPGDVTRRLRVLRGVFPDAAGRIFFDTHLLEGRQARIHAMEIIVGKEVEIEAQATP